MDKMPNGRVTAGDYKGKYLSTRGFVNLTPVLKLKALSFKKENEIQISSDTIARYEIKTEGVTQNKVGVKMAVVGAGKMQASKNNVQIALYWKDGKKSLVTCNGAMENLIIQSCF